MQRINLGKAAPELYKTVLELENLSIQKIQQAGGEIPIPLDDMPESEQQIELEELRKPLDIEKAEELYEND